MAHRRPRTPAGPLLDELTAERLVSGAAGPADVPPAYAPVARLLQAATGPAQDHEVEGEEQVRRMFVAELGKAGSAPTAPVRSRRSVPIARRFAAAAVVTGSLVVGGGVAAATGNLPAKAQSAAHDTLDAIGVDVPEPPDTSGSKSSAKGSGSSDPEKPSAFCAAATTGPCAVARDGETEDQGPDGGVEPLDPGDLGGAPGSVGPPSTTLGGSTDPSASTSEEPSGSTGSTPADSSDPRDTTTPDPDETVPPDTEPTDPTDPLPSDPPPTDPLPTDPLPTDPPPTSEPTPTTEEPSDPESDPDRSAEPAPAPEPDPEPTP